jgi:hypothetical protein
LQSVDGNDLGVTLSFLDRLTNCPGFADAHVSVGWLISRNGRLSVPNFDRHNGQTAKSRALTKDRVKRSRNGTSVTKALPEKRREEKRREERTTHTPSVLGQIGPPWDTTECAGVFDMWFSYLGRQNRAPLDRELATVSLTQMFSSPSEFADAVRAATAAGWLSVNPSMANAKPRNTRATTDDTITDADLEAMK